MTSLSRYSEECVGVSVSRRLVDLSDRGRVFDPAYASTEFAEFKWTPVLDLRLLQLLWLRHL